MSTYERLFSTVLYPAYESGLRRRKTLAYLAQYEAQQWLSPEALRKLQTEQLRSLLEHCQTQVPYWRRRFRELGFVEIRGSKIDGRILMRYQLRKKQKAGA